MSNNRNEQAIQVYIRVRPPISKEVQHKNAVAVCGGQTIQVVSENKEISCNFDRVFGETTAQNDVFLQVKPVLVDVLSGINACIFAYGQTSSGKSHTMIGPNGGQDIFRLNPSDWGILPRSAEFLMNYLNDKADEGSLTFEVKASFLQIYNENLYDLLRDTGPRMEDRTLPIDRDDNNILKIREVPKPKAFHTILDNHQLVPRNHTEIYIAGLSEYRVDTSEDIMKILLLGTKNRMTRSTDFNLTSSRSHAILTLTFTIQTQLESGQTIINKSKLNLIDLAGSEKLPYLTSEDTMEGYNKHVKELTAINKSLSCLGNVISALTTTARTHVPYRDSKLTRILQDSLGGNTKTVVIACVAPTVLHASETVSTLQFADRAKHVKYLVRANTIVDDKLTLAKAQAEIVRLKTLLANALKQLEDRQAHQNGNNQSSSSEAHNAVQLLTLETENQQLRDENAYLKSLLQQRAHLPVQEIDKLTAQHAAVGGIRESKSSDAVVTVSLSGKVRFAEHLATNMSNNQTNRRHSHSQSHSNPISSRTNYSLDSDDQESYYGDSFENTKSVEKLQHNAPLSNSSSTSGGGGPSPYAYNNILAKHPKYKKRFKQYAPQQKQAHHQIFSEINHRQMEELHSLLEQANEKIKNQYYDHEKQQQPMKSSKKMPASHPHYQIYDGHDGTGSHSHEASQKSTIPSKLPPLSTDNHSHQQIIPSSSSSSSNVHHPTTTTQNATNTTKPAPSSSYVANSNAVLANALRMYGYNRGPGKGAPAPQDANNASPTTQQNPTQDAADPSSAHNKPIELHNSFDDIGQWIEMFSFRTNTWEKVEIIDFSSNVGQHRCKFPDGAIVWLDLSKKPTRAME